ncbi:hypothetical protein DF185_05225 [Marinifilum breve]|uniref:Lipoprotein n=1 Tax=Marinifilum breve TaxID=2184082 RepID=A0A2V4A2F2_9BACT|nr:biopolymer transporter ExbD [Marinifilum breve]PXY02047.1 hypothetical protein DF185_05225 [Marinifilum breve]
MRNLLIIFCIILTSCQLREVKNTSETRITIEVKQNKEILLDGKAVEIKDIHQKLIDYKSSDKRNKKDKYLIELKVYGETKMGVIMEIKQELRKANMLKLEYKAIQ